MFTQPGYRIPSCQSREGLLYISQGRLCPDCRRAKVGYKGLDKLVDYCDVRHDRILAAWYASDKWPEAYRVMRDRTARIGNCQDWFIAAYHQSWQEDY